MGGTQLWRELGFEGAPRALWGPGAHLNSARTQGMGGSEGLRGAAWALAGLGGGQGAGWGWAGGASAGGASACPGTAPPCCHSNLGTGRALGAESAAALCKQQRGQRLLHQPLQKPSEGPAGQRNFGSKPRSLPRLSGPRRSRRTARGNAAGTGPGGPGAGAAPGSAPRAGPGARRAG